MEFAERMNRFGEGVFSRLAEIKRQKLEAGESVVDLSIGAPNIPPAQHILDVLCKEAADKSNYIYAINDQKDLLQAVSQWYERRYGVNPGPGYRDLLPARFPGGTGPYCHVHRG